MALICKLFKVFLLSIWQVNGHRPSAKHGHRLKEYHCVFSLRIQRIEEVEDGEAVRDSLGPNGQQEPSSADIRSGSFQNVSRLEDHMFFEDSMRDLRDLSQHVPTDIRSG